MVFLYAGESGQLVVCLHPSKGFTNREGNSIVQHKEGLRTWASAVAISRVIRLKNVEF
jgi:hypothetical protein